MRGLKLICLVLIVVAATSSSYARENVGMGKRASFYKTQASGCTPATAQIDLDINNVRATLLNGGDMWWNLSAARYEVPKIDPPGSAVSVSSIFAGAIWLGGIDAGGQLKVAAMTYRQTGNDFFPGPLDELANTNSDVCNAYNRFWVVYGAEIDTFRIKTAPIPVNQIPKHILEWPAKGNTYAVGADGVTALPDIDQDLAPFYDVNNDGVYSAIDGDYPVINADSGASNTYGDEMIFWMYNDKGNIHTETGGQAIGVQIGALAFAFSTSDEVNNMTFYRYNILNKATLPLNKTYMGQWVDPDLGCYNNDYVGCDTVLGLGICYNGTAADGGCAAGYGNEVPIIGVDYFEGPTDENNHQLGMSTFTYYNNDFSKQGNPEAAVHYYNYMVGFWKDGSCFTSDKCDAYGGTVCTHYMFPSDPNSSLTFPASWSECSCGNQAGDRRFLQASGPFTLNPGDVKHITVGVVWVRQQSQSGCNANFDLLRAADRKAQALFDNNFKLVDGPDAPTLSIRELSNEIILSLSNEGGSNNIGEAYDETDPLIAAIAVSDTSVKDSTYTFQGYKIYQLKSQTVTAENLDDATQARLIAQVDVKDTITRIINFENDPTVNMMVPVLKVNGDNQGIKHTFNVTNDAFATGTDQKLVNHKTYYFTAVAYAHNYYKSRLTGEVQITPYLQGRKNVKVYSGIPHSPIPSQDGTTLHAAYGDSIPVTRIQGAGNGGNSLDLTDETVQNILTSSNSFYGPIVYVGKHSPISVKVVDPYVLKNRKFRVTMLPNDTVVTPDSLTVIYTPDSLITKDAVSGEALIQKRARYRLDVLNPDGSLDHSFGTVGQIGTQTEFVAKFDNDLIEDQYGVSITLGQVDNVGDYSSPNGLGYMEATMQFKDSLVQWLTGVQDVSGQDIKNWVRSGNYAESCSGPTGIPDCYLFGFYDDYHTNVSATDCTPDKWYDENAEFNGMLSGTWAPYCLASNLIVGNIASLTGGACPGLPNSIYSYGPAFTVTYRYGNNSNILYAAGNYRANYRIPDNTLANLQSVDLVLTSDKSKWSRCIVVEMQEDSAIAENHALKGFYRKRHSLDIDRNLTADNDTGRSWFPGYAINVETGERLNLMFGEDSWLANENGRDMIWDPTANDLSPISAATTALFGGRHAIYIMDSRYDGCDSIHTLMKTAYDSSAYIRVAGTATNLQLRNAIDTSVYQHILWVTQPEVTKPEYAEALKAGNIPTETKIRLRIRKPFKQFVADATLSDDNDGFPQYEFSTEGLEPTTEQNDVAVNALDSIRVVPNPYYAYSAYETSQLDNEVKITNLPANTTVTIYSIDGTLIRRYQRSVTQVTSDGAAAAEKTNLDNSMNWDLKNSKNIPISSGVYLIHVNAPGIGEKVIKWFGVLRPTDLDTF